MGGMATEALQVAVMAVVAEVMAEIMAEHLVEAADNSGVEGGVVKYTFQEKTASFTVKLKGHTQIEGGVIGAVARVGASGEDADMAVHWMCHSYSLLCLHHIIRGPAPGVGKATRV